MLSRCVVQHESTETITRLCGVCGASVVVSEGKDRLRQEAGWLRRAWLAGAPHKNACVSQGLTTTLPSLLLRPAEASPAPSKDTSVIARAKETQRSLMRSRTSSGRQVKGLLRVVLGKAQHQCGQTSQASQIHQNRSPSGRNAHTTLLTATVQLKLAITLQTFLL